LSDPEGIIASPLTVIDREEGGVDEALRSLCAAHDVMAIVVGLPVTLAGEEGAAAKAAREFGARVAGITGRDVVFVDERFTTVVAEGALIESGMRRDRRREVKDKVAAAVALQSYLDRHHGPPDPA
jgi:putative Holliday junction resolvase